MSNKLLTNKYVLIGLGIVAIIGIIFIITSAEKNAAPSSTATPSSQSNFGTGKMPTPVQDKPVSGQIIVKFKPGYTTTQINRQLRQYDAFIDKTIEGINQTVVKVPTGKEDQVAQALKSQPYVETVQRDYTTHAFFVPNDPLFTTQYALNNSGQSVQGKTGAATMDVRAEKAWDVTQGNGVKVAILDTGINLNQPDLAGKVVAQKSFVSSTVEDGNGHGTHVAGIIAADTNNSTGIAGTCPGCQLIIGKVLDDAGSGTTSNATAGITWAADQGAKVINMSLGTTETQTSSLYAQAVSYALSKGAVVVAAAGNDGNSQNNYPAAASGVISVAAITNKGAKASYSNFGSYVKVAAPGDNILSTGPTHSFQLQPFGYSTSSPYYYLSGTSMAAPVVSGVAALVASTSFGASPQALANRIYTTADKISGTGSSWTYGLVDAAAAVGTAPTVAPSLSDTNITPTLFCVGGNGTPPCATIAPGQNGNTSPIPSESAGGGGGNNPSGQPSISVNPSNALISEGVSPAISGAPSGTPVNPGTPGANICSINANQLVNIVNNQNRRTVAQGGKTHIKCEPGQGGREKRGGKQRGGTSGGGLSQLFRLLLQLLLQLIQRLIGCLQQPGGGTPTPSPSISAAISPSQTISTAPSAGVSPSSAPSQGPSQPSSAAPTSGTAPTSPVTSSNCTNPKYTLPMNKSNPQDGVTIGNFYVDTDTWNAANYQLTQTMYVCDYNNWYAVANMNDTGDGAVKTYPNVHEDFNNKPLSSLSTITSSYAHVAPTVGNYDFAYDIWVNGVASSGSTEVMIWTQALGKQADAVNSYPSIGTTTIGGVTYNVHKSGNSYIAAQMTPYKASGTVDIKGIFNFLISKGVFPASSTLGAIDYGVEIVSTNGTNQTFKVTNFSLTAN